jgi:predicted ATPase/DNA-binding NarL/FixJ family response regulator/DNA-binding SARP family transcriptional activator
LEDKASRAEGVGSAARVLIADDHEPARSNLKKIFEGRPDLEVVAEAEDGREALKLCSELGFDLVLMDVRMPRMDGLEATRRIKARHPRTVVVVLTAFEDPDYLFEALEAGAAGYVLKHTDPEELLRALRKALSGEFPLDTELSTRLLRDLVGKGRNRETRETPVLPAEAVRVRLLGGFGVSVGSRTIEEGGWRLKKAGSLVKLLALARGHRLHRERVMDLLWPDLGTKAATNNLYRALHVARKALERAPADAASRYLALRGEMLALCPDGTLWVDVEAFEDAAVTARHGEEVAAYRAALELYTGELLPEDRYEEWAQERRGELRQLYLTLLVEMAGMYEEREDYEPAVEALRQAVSEESGREEAHRHLMRLFALDARRRQALLQYRRLEEILDGELDAEPDAQSRRLHEEILAGRFPQAHPRPATRTAGTLRGGAGKHNLPNSSSSFVGREQEMVEIRRSLAMTQLLTLTGAGGSGKTRLALEVARELVGVYPDGVWLVELAPLSEGALERAVAEAVGAREEPGRALEHVIAETLRDKRTLLLLDNCEHLVEAVADLVESLIPACPRLKILATSREVLGVAGESVWRVPPLSVPERQPSVGELERSEAARLFVDRAAPGFALTPENARAVAEVCEKLEGMPLAIELTAARVRTLSPGQISERLDDSLKLLTTGSQEAEPRQRTLRGALDWSHDLLPEDERALLRRLSVFAGGFTLEAAETVGGDAGDVLDLLANLADKSLVVAEAPFRARYRLLEPVRQYALEKLDEAGEGQAARCAHARFFLRLAESAEPRLAGAEQEEWLGRLELDHDNLRAAMGWFVERGDPEALLRTAGALWWYWCLRGHYGEGRGWLERALAAGGAAPPAFRAKALTAAGNLAFLQSEYGLARGRLEEGSALYRNLGDKRGTASAVQLLGSMAREQGRYARAEAFHGESLALWRELGEDGGVAHSLNYLGFVAWLQEDYGRATRLCTQALSMFRCLGEGEGIAWSLIMLGTTALHRGDRRRAAAMLEESLALSRRAGYREVVAWALNGLGILARREGRPERSETLLRESLSTHRDLGDRWRTASLLEALAGTAGALGRFERAAILSGAAEALREALSTPVPPCECTDLERDVAAARAGIDEVALRAAWAAGRAISLEKVYEYALTSEEEPPQEKLEEAAAVPLTDREQQIAALVARGLTNRRIAEGLSISERTVDTHVGRLLKKLGLHSREQVADHLEQRQQHEAG